MKSEACFCHFCKFCLLPLSGAGSIGRFSIGRARSTAGEGPHSHEPRECAMLIQEVNL
jgi:hypothetical protein